MDLISVIVPVYNTEKFLQDCINSILNQTYLNFELILVDDGSTDRSQRICMQYRNFDKRIKLISQKNSGVSDARNLGIEASRGTYIAFVDSDDMVKEDMLEILYQNILKSQTDLVTCNYEYDYSGHRIPRISRLASGYYKTMELKNMMIDDGTMSGFLFGSVCTCLYKKNIINDYHIRFDSNIKHNEDGLFNLGYLLHSTSILVLSDDYLYIYRNNDASVTNCYANVTGRFDLDCVIKKLYENENLESYQSQLSARKVSVGLWSILEICMKNNKESLVKKLKKIKEVCDDPDVVDGLRYINFIKLNEYKKIYVFLIKYKSFVVLYMLTRFVYPVFKKVVTR